MRKSIEIMDDDANWDRKLVPDRTLSESRLGDLRTNDLIGVQFSPEKLLQLHSPPFDMTGKSRSG